MNKWLERGHIPHEKELILRKLSNAGTKLQEDRKDSWERYLQAFQIIGKQVSSKTDSYSADVVLQETGKIYRLV